MPFTLDKGGLHAYDTRMEQEYPQQIQLTQEQYAALAKAYLNKVYMWMAGSMFVTAATAIYAMGSDKMLLFQTESGEFFTALLGRKGQGISSSAGHQIYPF